MDTKTTLAELKELVEIFVHQRDWEQFHNPKSLSMALAVEAAELMNMFKWQSPVESSTAMRRLAGRAAAAEEIADIVIYVLAFANRTGIDVARAVRSKLVKNNTRYPVNEYRGKY